MSEVPMCYKIEKKNTFNFTTVNIYFDLKMNKITVLWLSIPMNINE